MNIILFVLIYFGSSISIKFKVQPGEFQCVSDFLAKDVLFYAEINAENLLYKFTLSVYICF